MRFDGKVAVVTGASRGIGRAAALALAKEGCAVVVNYDKSEKKASEVVETIRAQKSRAKAVRCDVSVKNEVEGMFKTAVDEFGKVDILVNNAGIYITAPIMETTEELWDRTLDVNLKGAFLCIQAAAKYMIQRRYGKIVNISSNSGFGIAWWGETAYAASKGGIIQLTKYSAFELGQYGINVNCIAPGDIETDAFRGGKNDQEYAVLLDTSRKISSLGTVGKPEDIANAVLFFASDDARFITGKALLVDGGRRDYI